MTWTNVADQSTDYEFPTDIDDNYFVIGYFQNDYIEPEGIWTDVANVSTSWA
jgi:hypothetical protein